MIESWNRWGSWVTTPMAVVMLNSRSWRTSMPSISTVPAVTSYSRGTSDDMVVLPAPDGPTSAVMVPGAAVNDTPRSTQSDGPVSATAVTVSSDATDTSDPAG